MTYSVLLTSFEPDDVSATKDTPLPLNMRTGGKVFLRNSHSRFIVGKNKTRHVEILKNLNPSGNTFTQLFLFAG